ncbi:GIY-YIG nuclease family protein [Cellulomonas sp. PSBB021]|uniref:GIY-YIG nuclease family protein n=1 Tax=Cellulomonas sp. PSBB021 TaxID=2003551 RepID=UPI000B8DA20A|nr:GIY-YIG nuclease family protein [Cellulomonas sp. PSBB021]ASR55240.1 hypothetical protein CBP52_09265 [Cellulomonas sp. PSBB021]
MCREGGDEHVSRNGSEMAAGGWRNRYAGSWLIAAELVRRGGREVFWDDHPQGVAYDNLHVQLVDPSEAEVSMNRGGALHLWPDHPGWMQWDEAFEIESGQLADRMLAGLGLALPSRELSLRAVTYSAIASILTALSTDGAWDARPWEQRSETDERGFEHASRHLMQMGRAGVTVRSWKVVRVPRSGSSFGRPVVVLTDDGRLFLPDGRTSVDLRNLPMGPSADREAVVGLQHDTAGSRPDVAEPAAPVREFSTLAQEAMRYYVYLLRDSRDGTVFYVGKGIGNRAFDHARDALGGDAAPSDKLDRIRSILASDGHVQVEVVRHGIESEKHAFVVEASVIDALRAVGHPLTNKVLGHDVALRGWANAEVVNSIYDAAPLGETKESLVLLKIPRLWTPAMPSGELYEATRGWWVMSGTTAGRARTALAVSKGVVRAAYEVAYWRERVEGDRDYIPLGKPRLGFFGKAIDRPDIVNKSVKHLKGQNPVMYLNCGPEQQQAVPVYRGEIARKAAASEA